jgi:hypothetical protein
MREERQRKLICGGTPSLLKSSKCASASAPLSTLKAPDVFQSFTPASKPGETQEGATRVLTSEVNMPPATSRLSGSGGGSSSNEKCRGRLVDVDLELDLIRETPTEYSRVKSQFLDHVINDRKVVDPATVKLLWAEAQKLHAQVDEKEFAFALWNACFIPENHAFGFEGTFSVPKNYRRFLQDFKSRHPKNEFTPRNFEQFIQTSPSFKWKKKGTEQYFKATRNPPPLYKPKHLVADKQKKNTAHMPNGASSPWKAGDFGAKPPSSLVSPQLYNLLVHVIYMVCCLAFVLDVADS